jgi:hypothetical protein
VITPKAVGAGETAMNLTAGCGGAAASAAQVGSFCPVKAKTTTDKKKLTEFQKIQEADAKARAERFQTMKDLQAKIFDVQMDVTENKAKRVDRFFHKYDQYIRANAGSPGRGRDAAGRRQRPQRHVPAAEHGSRPRTAGSHSPGRRHRRQRHPAQHVHEPADRLLLSLAGIIGCRVLVHDLGSRKALTIASASARVPARGTRRLKLKASGLGGRALRILALSPKGGVRLTVSSRGRSRSRAIEIG